MTTLAQAEAVAAATLEHGRSAKSAIRPVSFTNIEIFAVAGR